MKESIKKELKRPLIQVFIVLIFISILILLFIIFFENLASYLFAGSDSPKGELIKFAAYVIGGLFAIYALYLNAKRTKALDKQNKITEKGKVDERFKNAIEHLGDKNDAIVLGGVYALHHIAKDYKDYRETVFNILCSYIREKTNEKEYLEKYKESPSNVIQTIIDLLFKKREGENYIYKNFKANLYAANLMKADLMGADLVGSDLREAKLMKANLYIADLEVTLLDRADLMGAKLMKANLMRADLMGANLMNTKLMGANLMDAGLMDADLFGTNLKGANLEGTFFFKSDWDKLMEWQKAEIIGEPTIIKDKKLINEGEH